MYVMNHKIAVCFGTPCTYIFCVFRYGPDGRKLDDTPGRHNTDYTIKTYLERENARTQLQINKLKLSNAGTYTVKVTNGVETKTENFTLILRKEPSVQMSVINPKGLYSQGQEYSLKCSAEGYPIPNIQWLFKPCQSYYNCDNRNSMNVANLIDRRHRVGNTHTSVSLIREVARRSGQFICQACNKIGCVYQSTDFFVTDVPDEGFSVSGPENVLEGEEITLKCSASTYNFSSVQWFKDTLSGEKKLSQSNFRYKVQDSSTDFSFTKKLTLANVTLGDKGRYVCRGQRLQTPMTAAAAISSSPRRSSSNVDASLVAPSELSFQV